MLNFQSLGARLPFLAKTTNSSLRISPHTETRWSPGDADRDADRERTSRMPTSGTSAASAGPGPGELSTFSPFAENAWVNKQLHDAL